MDAYDPRSPQLTAFLLYVPYATEKALAKAHDRSMSHENKLHIVSADRIREGVLLGFSDGVVVLYPTAFLIALRDRTENTRIPEDAPE